MTLSPEPMPEEEGLIKDSLISDSTVDDLFTDVETTTELIDVVLKGAPDLYEESKERTSLARARQLLREGRVLGVQLRYRYLGREWWDTLLAAPGGARLVRIEQTHRPSERRFRHA